MGTWIILGWLVGKIIIIILSFRVSTSKNKNIDHWGKETCAFMSIQVTYETDCISLLCDSTMSNAPNFCFYVFFNLKEKDYIRRNINSKKRNIYVWNQYYYYFDLPKIRVSQAHTTKK